VALGKQVPREDTTVGISSRCRNLVSCSLAVLLWLSGCGGGAVPSGGQGDISGDTLYVTGYEPYVEGVAVPDQVYAGDFIYVDLQLSSVLKPDLLAGATMNSLLAPVTFHPLGYVIDTWMWPTRNARALIMDTVQIKLPPMPVGEWSIMVWQLKNRNLGGKEGVCQWMPSTGGPRDDMEFVTYPITVIERPGK
jgi:hypothetical protein